MSQHESKYIFQIHPSIAHGCRTCTLRTYEGIQEAYKGIDPDPLEADEQAHLPLYCIASFHGM